MVFKSRKDVFFILIYLNIQALLIVLLISRHIPYVSSEHFRITDFVVLTLISIFLISIFNTKYTLSKNKLKYRSCFIRGEIAIENITEIIKGKTLWTGIKPATAINGLIIKYNKFDELYISPKTNEDFIAEILKLNSNIKIT